MDKPQTCMKGVWVDPRMEWNATLGKTGAPRSVQITVQAVTQQVVTKVNSAYTLDPPLKEDMVATSYYPKDADPDSNVHDLDLNGLLVLVSPKPEHTRRVKSRFKELKDSDKAVTKVFNEFSSDSEDDEDTDSGDRIGKLVNMFRNFRDDVDELKAETLQLSRALVLEHEERMTEDKSHKAETLQLSRALVLEHEERMTEGKSHKEETARLNRALILEQEERKVETTRLNRALILEQEERKVETTRLNRALILEQEERKAEGKTHKEETARLKTTLFKEREGIQVDRARLEATIERQDRELVQSELSRQRWEAELAKAKAQLRDDMQTISELTVKLIPIQLRVLLDCSRQRMLQHMKFDSWEDLRCESNISQLTDSIMREFANVEDRLSRETVVFLCSYNNIRRDGNYYAHSASQEEIKNAVENKGIDSQDRHFLEQLYKFVFRVPI